MPHAARQLACSVAQQARTAAAAHRHGSGVLVHALEGWLTQGELNPKGAWQEGVRIVHQLHCVKPMLQRLFKKDAALGAGQQVAFLARTLHQHGLAVGLAVGSAVSPYLQHQFCSHRAATCCRRRRCRRLRPSAQGPAVHLGARLSLCHDNQPSLSSRWAREEGIWEAAGRWAFASLAAIHNCLASLPGALAAARGAPRSAAGFWPWQQSQRVAGTHRNRAELQSKSNKARAGAGGATPAAARRRTVPYERQARNSAGTPVLSHGQLRLRTRSNSVNWIKSTRR